MHKLQHRPVHGGDSPTHNHRLQLQFEAGGFLNQGILAVKHKAYRRTHSQDSPSDRHGTQPSNNPHRMACGEQQVVNLLSEVLSVLTLKEYPTEFTASNLLSNLQYYCILH